MGFSTCTATVTYISSLSDLPNLDDGLTPAQLKAKFDAAGSAIKSYINDVLIAEIEDTTSSQSGASKVGVESIPGVTGNDIQTVLESIAALGTGALPPDGSITNAKLATDVKVGSLAALTTNTTSSVVAAINELDSDLGTDVTNLATHTASASLHLTLLTTEGDTLYRGASAPARLPKGSARQALLMNAGASAPEWGTSMQSLLTAAGDIIYASAANTPQRLALGTALQILQVNSGGTAPEWVTPPKVASGSYTGNGSADRQITVGFRPKFLFVMKASTNVRYALAIDTGSTTHSIYSDGTEALDSTSGLGTMHANGFTTGSGAQELNGNGVTYFWAAFS